MPFDPSSAVPENTFDPSTATVFDPSSAQVVDNKELIKKLTPPSVDTSGPIVGLAEGATEVAGGMAAMFPAALYAIEQQGMRSLMNTIPGIDLGSHFTEDFDKAQKAIADVVPFQAETPVGKKVADILSSVYSSILTGVGDFAAAAQEHIGEALNPALPIAQAISPQIREATKPVPLSERPDVAAVGAGAQALAVLAGMKGLLEGKKAAGKIEEPIQPAAKTFTEQNPATARYLDASEVGTLHIDPAEPTKPFIQVTNDALDKALGITQDMKDANPQLATMPVQDKIGLMIDKASAATGELIPPEMKAQYITDTVTKLTKLQQYADSIQAEKAPKQLPSPRNATEADIQGMYAHDEPVSVDSTGKATTLDQQVEYAQKFQSMTPENRARSMGIGPMGVLDTKLAEYNRLQDIAKQSDKPVDFRAAIVAKNELKRTWASIFDNPKDTYARNSALDQYIESNGQMSYDNALKLVGPRKGTGMKQGGAFDIEGLEKNAEALKYLGEGVARYARYGFISPLTYIDKSRGVVDGQKTLYRRIPDDGTIKPQVGMQFTDIPPMSEISRFPELARIEQYQLPVDHLVKSPSGGFIYTPPGTDLSNVAAFKNAQGEFIHYSDLSIDHSPIINKQRGAFIPFLDTQIAKQSVKDAVRQELAFGRITRDYAVRGTTLDELQYIANNGRMLIGKDAEGNAGISAATVHNGDFPVYGKGVGIIAKPDTFESLDMYPVGSAEVLINPKTDPRTLQYIIDGKVMNFDEMKKTIDHGIVTGEDLIKALDRGQTKFDHRDIERIAKDLGVEYSNRERPMQAIHDIRVAIESGVGKKQGGAFDIEGLDKLAQDAQDKLRAKWVVSDPNIVANQVKETMEKNANATLNSEKTLSTSLIKDARRMVYAHDYDIRKAFENAGIAGKEVHDRMIVQNGATMAAKVKMDAINKAIFDNLDHSEIKSLNEVTRLRRIIQIDKYKGLNVVRHEDGITGPMALARIEQMKTELGNNFNKVNDASTAIFEQQKLLLNDLRDNGLISNELHAKLYNLDYTRTEYLDIIDPSIPIASHIRNMPLSIRSSGIPELGRGKHEYVNIDAQALLMEDVARVENRIFRNNTLKAARELAVKNPDNGIVVLPNKTIIKTDSKGNQTMRHTPEGFTSIGVRVEGRQEFILMKDEFAEQFISRPETLPEWLAVTFRTISGTSMIKATSTGYNPAFPLAGIPMDIFHTWVTSTDVYSPHLPVYLAQIGMDMTATAKDAFTKSGAWKDAMQEGIGSSYLTHESKSITDPSKSLRSQMAPHFAKTRTALSYLNDTTDMWIRLAYRNRLINSGMESWKATATSRDRLDYYQGGAVVKAFDTMIPYANVGVQATGKAIEAAARDPKAMLTKAAWAAAAATGFKMASMITSPETDKDMAVNDKVRNFNITFGDQYYFIDQNGNKRYMYIPVRLDQVIMPLNASVVGGLELSEYGRVPEGIAGNAIGQIAPANSAIPIPTIDAIATYMSNYDQYTKSTIYKGPKVKPEDEIRTFGEGKPTSQLAVAAGQATGASPMRLQAAAGKLINSNNFYIQAMSGANTLLFQGADPRQQAASTLQILQNIPGLNNVVKFTTPGVRQMQDLQKAEEAAGSIYAPMFHAINDINFQYEHKQNGVTQKNITEYINKQPEQYRQQLYDHVKYTIQVDKVMEHYKASDGIPPKTWWISSAKIAPEVRGQVFYNEWVASDQANRDRMVRIAGSLQQAGIGYMSDDFQKSFANERKMFGDEKR